MDKIIKPIFQKLQWLYSLGFVLAKMRYVMGNTLLTFYTWFLKSFFILFSI